MNTFALSSTKSKMFATTVLIAGFVLIGLKAIAISALVAGIFTVLLIEISQRFTLHAIGQVELLPDQKLFLPLTVVDHTHDPDLWRAASQWFDPMRGIARITCVLENLHPRLGMRDLLVFVKREEVVLQTIYLPARFLGEFPGDKVLGIRKLLCFLSRKYGKA